MKKITLLVFIFSCISTSAFAGEGHEKTPVQKMEDRAPIAYNFDFSVEQGAGRVSAQWNPYNGEGFQWYKLVYSTTNPNPVYPVDTTMFVGNKDQLKATFKLKAGASKHYVRVCAVVLNDDYSKDRYCSDVKFLDMTIDAYPDKTDYEKKETVKKYYEEKEATQKKTITKKTLLSQNIKERVDTFLEKFIKRLKDTGLSDTEMVEKIDTVLERLTKYKGNTKYEALISYMESVLHNYRTDYDSGLDDLESIFSDL